MKLKNSSLLAVISFIPLTINAQNVYLKNIYTTSTGIEKQITIQTNNGKYDVDFNKDINLGLLNTITKLTIKTSTTLPVDISHKVTQLKQEAPQKENQNALLIVYPSNPLNLGTWNINRQWLPQRPTNQAPTMTPRQFENFPEQGGFLKRVKIMDTVLGSEYKQKMDIITHHKDPHLFNFISTYMDKKDISIKQLKEYIDHAIYSITAEKEGF